MAEFWTEKRVVIHTDTADLADAVARRFLVRVAKRVAGGHVVHIALTGGTSGTAVLAAAGRNPTRSEIDWSQVHFWWGDERFVPRAHSDRNDRGAWEGFLNHIDVPAENVHSMAASDDGVTLDEGADAYAAELARFGDSERAWPSFDVCFLGVGPDGHIASLFPDRPEIQVVDRGAVAVRDSPKPPPERISLTRPVINASQRVWMVLSGADKASALGLVLAGASYESVPAAGAKGRKRTMLFVDEAAAADVPDELIAQDY